MICGSPPSYTVCLVSLLLKELLLFTCPAWSEKAVQTLEDTYNENGLFSDLHLCLTILQSSTKANGVPWNTPLNTHPLQKKDRTRGLVSQLYSLFRTTACKSLSIVHLWTKELTHYFVDGSVNWDGTWS